MTIKESVENFLRDLPEFNPLGEKITVVAAVKTQPIEAILEAVEAGIAEVGENHVQEFRANYPLIPGGVKRHFIGHLQTNKIKYLLGKCDLYQSVDRLNLATELSKRSAAAGITSNILLQINAGNEESKGGFSFEEIEGAYAEIKALPALKIKGLMAMLPFTDDEALLKSLAHKMRETYDNFKKKDEGFEYLSMGMSGDCKLCIECGSNMVRIGTTLFGKRK